jgi:hypothetical protein
MPAPTATQTQESVRTDAHYLFTVHQAKIAETAYSKLDTLSIPGGSSMPYFEWGCPTGEVFIYSPGNGQLRLDGTDYSSLSPDLKIIFFRWLNHFMHKCMLKYNKEYGL